MTHPREPSDPFVDLTDAAATDAAVQARAERRDRQERAAATATWIGTLRDLAERRGAVALTTPSGRALRGALVGVSNDHLVLAQTSGEQVHLRLAAVRAVRPEPGQPDRPATGDRPAPVDATVEDVLDGLVEDGRPAVLLVRDLADPVRGEVCGVGEDVVTVRLAGPERQLVYLPATAVDGVLLT